MRASSARLFRRAILFGQCPLFEVAMRLAFAASCLYLCLFAIYARADSAQAPSPSTPATGTTGTTSANDAAAKHAKRTACLQDAKTKKLVGADKTAFLKTCNAA
jgi:hypothetical protein